MQRMFVLLQYVLPQGLISRIMGKFARSQTPWLKNAMIKAFIRRYKVNMRDAIIENPEEYTSFNQFFMRQLKKELRPIVQGAQQIACPVDGCVSQIGKIEQDKLFQAKGFYFDLKNLVGGNESLAKQFINGTFATLYLAPKDYHRVHIPLSGHLRETTYIPGKLFSVNQTTAEAVPQLFSRNERLVCLFDTEAGPMLVIFVGAMIVGNIETTWDYHPRSNHLSTKHITDIYFDKGAELGYFNLGSTVILLFGENKITWERSLLAETNVKMGESLGFVNHLM